MARGKRSNVQEIKPEDMLNIGEEVGAPNLLIDDEYGITGKLMDYALVQKKVATRTAKEEDIPLYGEDCVGKMICYTKWEDIAYLSNIQSCYEKYIKVKNLSEFKAHKKLKDITPLIESYKQTQLTVLKSIKSLELDKNSAHTCELYETIGELREAIRAANAVLEEADELHNLIKEKRQIIIKDTTPKKHRTPKDTSDLSENTSVTRQISYH